MYIIVALAESDSLYTQESGMFRKSWKINASSTFTNMFFCIMFLNAKKYRLLFVIGFRY